MSCIGKSTSGVAARGATTFANVSSGISEHELVIFIDFDEVSLGCSLVTSIAVSSVTLLVTFLVTLSFDILGVSTLWLLFLFGFGGRIDENFGADESDVENGFGVEK